MIEYVYYCDTRYSCSIFRYTVLKETKKMFYVDDNSGVRIVNQKTGSWADYNYMGKQLRKEDYRVFTDVKEALAHVQTEATEKLKILREQAAELMTFQETVNEIQTES